jgi:hypothetical protein
MSRTDEPHLLRKRAGQLQEIARLVSDAKAVEALNEFVKELETRAALLEHAAMSGGGKR